MPRSGVGAHAGLLRFTLFTFSGVFAFIQVTITASVLHSNVAAHSSFEQQTSRINDPSAPQSSSVTSLTGAWVAEGVTVHITQTGDKVATSAPWGTGEGVHVA